MKTRVSVIGHVRNNISGRLKPGERDKQISKIILKPEFEKGLEKIGECSHLFVICWMHKVPESERKTRAVFYKQGREEIKVGVFAARVQFRPNPISLNLVELLKVGKDFITVRGLEMFNNTPVLDIKPFTGFFKDVPKELFSNKVRVAPWYNLHPLSRG